MTNLEIYKNELKRLVGTIEFENVSLGSKNLIYTYQKSKKDSPLTQIHIYRRSVSLQRLESKLENIRHNIVTEVLTSVQNREQKAQDDMDYLITEICKLYTDNLGNVQWINGYLSSETFTSSPLIYSTGYFVQSVAVEVVERYIVTR